MTDRRSFIRKAGALAAGGLGLSVLGCASGEASEEVGAVVQAGAAEPGAAGALEQIGLQLYTLRSLMEDRASVSETLAAVAEIGYDTVETAGLYELTPQTLRRMFDDYGLRSPAGHYALGAMREDFEHIAHTAQTLGQQYVVCPYLTAQMRASRDDYRALAEEFNRLGERFQAEGLRFAYHNHHFEFEMFGGERPAYDLLLEKTDPELVDFEMDLYWIYKAGYDPLVYFERYPGRFKLFHIKGGTAPPEKEMVSVGQGAMDFAAIFAHADQAGLEHAFVEHDRPQNPLQSIRTSYQYLRQLAP